MFLLLLVVLLLLLRLRLAAAAATSAFSRAHARVLSVFEEIAYFATTMLSTRRTLIIELNKFFD